MLPCNQLPATSRNPLVTSYIITIRYSHSNHKPPLLSDQYLMATMAKQGRKQISQMSKDQVHPLESNVASHLEGPLGVPSQFLRHYKWILLSPELAPLVLGFWLLSSSLGVSLNGLFCPMCLLFSPPFSSVTSQMSHLDLPSSSSYFNISLKALHKVARLSSPNQLLSCHSSAQNPCWTLHQFSKRVQISWLEIQGSHIVHLVIVYLTGLFSRHLIPKHTSLGTHSQFPKNFLPKDQNQMLLSSSDSFNKHTTRSTVASASLAGL